MGITWGNANIGTVYYGSKPIKEIYQGSTLVWQKKPDNIMILSYSDGTTANVEVSGELTTDIVRSGGDYKSLVSAVIPSSVTSIGGWAFMSCSKVASIEIPDSVTSIGEGAFSDCPSLVDINIPTGVTSLNTYVLQSCSGLTSFEIPSSITSIGDCAFDRCSGLTSIKIPNSVTSIGAGAFSRCSSLTSFELSASVTSISPDAVSLCPVLTSIVVASDNPVYEDRSSNCIIQKSDNTLVVGCVGTVIPSSVTSIGHNAFVSCTGLTSIVIPNSVTSIATYTFWGCTNLTAIYCEFAEGDVSGAPWNATNATVYYDWSAEQAAMLAATPMTLDLYEEECTHPNLNERCYCPDCRKYQHVPDENCKCKCGYEQHSYNADGVCTLCGMNHE